MRTAEPAHEPVEVPSRVDDGSSGLADRTAFQERLEAEFADASRSGRPLTLLALGVDGLADLAELQEGRAERLLLALTGLLRSRTDDRDLVCRVGAAEFALIFPGSDTSRASAVAEAIAEELRRLEPQQAPTLSIGLAEAPGEAREALELFACAHLALLEAKAFGGNRTVCFGDYASALPTRHLQLARETGQSGPPPAAAAGTKKGRSAQILACSRS